ncbi:hypothetical protein DWZ35_08135 [Bacteroides caccae]|nr:hypothetical protein DWZ35_08135 [Bacteroides caccae]
MQFGWKFTCKRLCYRALRVGLLTYIHEFSDEEIKNGWGFFDSPAGVRAKMQRILDEISKK